MHLRQSSRAEQRPKPQGNAGLVHGAQSNRQQPLELLLLRSASPQWPGEVVPRDG
jgi:hypothetical protein